MALLENIWVSSDSCEKSKPLQCPEFLKTSKYLKVSIKLFFVSYRVICIVMCFVSYVMAFGVC